LGNYAYKLIIKMLRNNDIILFSDLIVRELKAHYAEKEINDFFALVSAAGILKRVNVLYNDCQNAKLISNIKNLPVNDVIHAILAVRNHAILVSQDKHMQKLKDVAQVKRPEEVI